MDLGEPERDAALGEVTRNSSIMAAALLSAWAMAIGRPTAAMAGPAERSIRSRPAGR